MSHLIVTGVDGSETAAAAASRAAELAGALQARLHIVSAYGRLEAETVEVGSDKLLLSNEGEAESTAEAVAAPLREAHPGLEITTGPSEGKPGEALVRVADSLGATMIVVGNKRVQGVSRVFGSIARHVAAHAPCDVYVVNTHQRG